METLRDIMAGQLASASTYPRFDADHVVQDVKHICIGTPTADADFTFALWTPDTNVILTAADFIPCVTTAANDTNYLTLALSKGDAAAGALTVVGTGYTTKVTGGDALTARTARAWTLLTDSAQSTIARGTTIYLVQTHAATGPAWGGTVRLTYKLVG